MMQPTVEASTSSSMQLTEGWAKELQTLYCNAIKYADAAVSFKHPEDVHQARVHIRKLMSLLKVTGDSVVRDSLLSSLRKAHKLLGRIRDRDVLIASFKQRRRAAVHKERRKLLKAFIRHQKDERKQARSRAKAKLPKLTKKRIAKQWAAFVKHELGGSPQHEQMNNYLLQLERQFDEHRIHYEQSKQGRGMTDAETLEALHKVRLQVKELRYFLKHVDLADSVDIQRKRQYYEQLQESLGRINDRRVWIARWNDIGPRKLEADPAAYRAMVRELEEELTQEIGRLQIERPAIDSHTACYQIRGETDEQKAIGYRSERQNRKMSD
ncbi:CHAD domain-containing protein [Paenibacillus xerothermodurans]|uniref:CHAD domain-containing protein n=1 Tax=Paenibacillus xerothermodurans TaxID=1977292 RepID=A0A2W1NEL9_PAEXE|nr:CHAD domain-containing protein [Paenibacillus xerothermodurans]PZE22090.1 CHAD domain-containing protein [Paenibacillus xerothermodurans]